MLRCVGRGGLFREVGRWKEWGSEFVVEKREPSWVVALDVLCGWVMGMRLVVVRFDF